MNNDEPIPRTPEEIAMRLRELGEGPALDLYGAERSRLLEALPFEDAQQFLEPDHPHTAEAWEIERTKSCGSAIGQIRMHLGFAWAKANECSNSSVQRALSHFKGLLWLLGSESDGLREWIEEPDNYEYFGKPALARISELIDFTWQHPSGPDDDEWKNVKDGESVTANVALGLE